MARLKWCSLHKHSLFSPSSVQLIEGVEGDGRTRLDQKRVREQLRERAKERRVAPLPLKGVLSELEEADDTAFNEVRSLHRDHMVR